MSRFDRFNAAARENLRLKIDVDVERARGRESEALVDPRGGVRVRVQVREPGAAASPPP